MQRSCTRSSQIPLAASASGCLDPGPDQSHGQSWFGCFLIPLLGPSQTSRSDFESTVSVTILESSREGNPSQDSPSCGRRPQIRRQHRRRSAAGSTQSTSPLPPRPYKSPTPGHMNLETRGSVLVSPVGTSITTNTAVQYSCTVIYPKYSPKSYW